jgi:hypothetical protein
MEALLQADWLIDYTPSRSLPLDQEALRIYEYAYQLGLRTEGTGNPPVSFTTLLIALLVGEDETSRWFADLARQIAHDFGASRFIPGIARAYTSSRVGSGGRRYGFNRYR